MHEYSRAVAPPKPHIHPAITLSSTIPATALPFSKGSIPQRNVSTALPPPTKQDQNQHGTELFLCRTFSFHFFQYPQNRFVAHEFHALRVVYVPENCLSGKECSERKRGNAGANQLRPLVRSSPEDELDPHHHRRRDPERFDRRSREGSCAGSDSLHRHVSKYSEKDRGGIGLGKVVVRATTGSARFLACPGFHQSVQGTLRVRWLCSPFRGFVCRAGVTVFSVVYSVRGIAVRGTLVALGVRGGRVRRPENRRLQPVAHWFRQQGLAPPGFEEKRPGLVLVREIERRLDQFRLLVVGHGQSVHRGGPHKGPDAAGPCSVRRVIHGPQNIVQYEPIQGEVHSGSHRQLGNSETIASDHHQADAGGEQVNDEVHRAMLSQIRGRKRHHDGKQQQRPPCYVANGRFPKEFVLGDNNTSGIRSRPCFAWFRHCDRAVPTSYRFWSVDTCSVLSEFFMVQSPRFAGVSFEQEQRS
mmetsp:Transcript_24450/g.57777  ORF Transcript_24450/g.57777 Transcript_24450/m.57777 type:complete len:471 (+) Transcript_24450:2230-3642(+)